MQPPDLSLASGPRRGQKSIDAYRIISEVAEDLRVEPHVLRFWESKFKQIEPLKRAGGRRYYRPRDIDLLRRIQHLLHAQGYTIKGVQKLLSQDKFLTDVSVASKLDTPTPSYTTLAVNDDQPAALPLLSTPQTIAQTITLQQILAQLKAIRAQL